MARLTIADHERDVKVVGCPLERDAVGAGRGQSLLLIVLGVVTELASRSVSFQRSRPITFQFGSFSCLCCWHRKESSKTPKGILSNSGLPANGAGSASAASTEISHGVLEHLGQMLGELRLKAMVRDRLPQRHGAVVDMIFGPEPEAGLEEGQAGVSIIPGGQLFVELESETSELGTPTNPENRSSGLHSCHASHDNRPAL